MAIKVQETHKSRWTNVAKTHKSRLTNVFFKCIIESGGEKCIENS